MQNKTVISIIFSSIIFSVSTAACASGRYETWTEKMICSAIQYRIESVCKKTKDESDLNECKSQTLFVTKDVNTRSIKLPEITSKGMQKFKKAKHRIELYATSWKCVPIEAGSFLEIEYSDGSLGNNEFAEDATFYDLDGKLIDGDHRTDPRIGKITLTGKTVKTIAIRSIMHD